MSSDNRTNIFFDLSSTALFYSFKRFICTSFLALLSFFVISAVPNIIVLEDITIDKGDAAVAVAPNIDIVGGGDFNNGYIEFSLADATAGDTFALTSSLNPTASNEISIQDEIVFLGDGSVANRIGSIDQIRNGENGKSLRINFFIPLENGSFESGSTAGWTTFEQKYPNQDDFHGDAIPWELVSNSTSGTGTVNIAPSTNANYSVAPDSNTTNNGAYSLRLFISGNVSCTTPGSGTNTDGYCSTYGPYVESAPFEAFAGDKVTLSWLAQNGGDWYEVIGFIIGDGADDTFDTADDTLTELFSQRGDKLNTFQSNSTNVPSDDTYKFQFIAGTYDASGYLGVGASLYLDDIAVELNNNIADSLAVDIAKLVTYENTDVLPPDAARLMTVTAVAGDGGTNSLSANITIDTNTAPVITSNGGAATAAVSIDENTQFVTTIAATDLENDILSFAIIGGSDALEFTIDTVTGVLELIESADYEAQTNYSVIVEVIDSSKSDTQSISLTINNVDETPEITSNGGVDSANISVQENQTAVTTVTATDQENDVLTYAIVPGADSESFLIDANTGVLSFVEAPDFETKAAYEVDVSVSDALNTAMQTLNVNVTDVNEAPVILTSGGGSNAAVTIKENSTSLITVAASDVDDDVLSYSISGGSAQAYFKINSETGTLDFVNAPNYEEQDTYTVTVSVSDGALEDTQTLVVTVTDVNEAPEITSNGGGATTSLQASENNTSVTVVSAHDDDGNTLTYRIEGGVDATAFTLSESTGVLEFVTAPDFEQKVVYTLVVGVSDGALSDTQTLIINIVNINESPIVTAGGGGGGGGDLSNLSVLENQTDIAFVGASDPENGTLSYSISGGVDAATVVIDSYTGQLEFLSAPNYEVKSSYVIQVTVSDGVVSSVQDIFINITDENEAPVIMSYDAADAATITIAEGVLTVSTVSAIDEDGNVLVYSIAGGNDAALFNIDSSTGEISLISPADFEIQQSFELVVAVSDGTLLDMQGLTIIVDNINEAPVIQSVPTAGATPGIAYIYDVNATDPDFNSVLTYSIMSGPDYLTIDANTGLLSGIAVGNDADVVTVTVRVSDGVLFAEQTFPITVTPLPDLDADGIADVNDPDIDGDGLPNDWETSFGLDPRDASTPTEDPDGDSLSNQEEFERGSSPIVDDRSLITNPSSGGGFSPLLILLLMPVVYFRRKNVKVSAKSFGAIFVILLSTSAAQAEYKVGAQLLGVKSDESISSLNKQLKNDGLNVDALGKDTVRTGFSVFAQMPIMGNFSGRLSYVDLGEGQAEFFGLDVESVLNNLEEYHVQTANGVSLTGIYTYSVDENWHVSAQLGAYRWSADYDYIAAQEQSKYSESGWDVTYGITGTRDLVENVSLDFGWQRFHVDSVKIDSLQIGIVIDF